MEDFNFDPSKHQKVLYHGKDGNLIRSSLFIVVKEEFPDLYQMDDDDVIVIHIVNQFDEIIINSDPRMRNYYKVKVSEIQFVAPSYKP